MMYRISPSSLSTFTNCPASYYFSYILELPSEPSIHLLKGSLVHEVMEQLPKVLTWNSIKDSVSSEMILKARLVELASGIMDSFMDNADLVEFISSFPDENYTDVMNDIGWCIEGYLIHLVRSFFTNIRGGKKPYQAWRYLLPTDTEIEIVVDTDLKITRKYPPDVDGGQPEYAVPVKLKGIIDAAMQLDWGSETIQKAVTGLADWKTSKVFRMPITDEYIFQLWFYSYLWKLKFGESPKYLLIWYLRTGTPTVIIPPPDDQLEKEIVEKVGLLVNAVQTRTFVANPCSRWCDEKYCDYWGPCHERGFYDGTKMHGDVDPDWNR